MVFLLSFADRFRILFPVLIIFPALLVAIAMGQATRHPIKVAGERHTLVLLSDGSLIGWGPCDWGELGPITPIPQNRNWATAFVSIVLPRKAIDVAAGESASLALLDDGSVVSWGSNRRMLLGNGEAGKNVRLPDGKNGSEKPIRAQNLTDIVKISAADGGAVALKKDGTVYAWGQLFASDVPVRVKELRNILQISVGTSHAMALDAAGNVWTWGGNMYGVLGRKTDSQSPAQVPGLSGVVSIAAGFGVATVVKGDGTVWVWGANFQGQFGNGQRTNAPVYGGLSNEIETTPQQVPGVRNAAEVVSGIGGRHTLVLLKDGTLRGWGNTDWGQLGTGVSGTFQLTPAIPKISGVKAVFAVQNNSYALKNDNSFWIWGIGNNEFPLKINVKLPRPLTLD